MHELSASSISPNRNQPRKRINPDTLAELAASIKEKGVATPIIVRRSSGGYEIIAGERRWRAARQAGLKTVPAIIREATDREALELALVENIQREDLSPIEEATSFQILLKDISQEELAKRIGKDRATVANTLRLLKLPVDIQEAVSSQKLTAGHARAILQMDTPAAQQHLFRQIIRRDLSVRQAEEIARHRQQAPITRTRKPMVSRAIEEDLSRSLGTKVRIRKSGKSGSVIIEFYSEEELERLIGILSKH